MDTRVALADKNSETDVHEANLALTPTRSEKRLKRILSKISGELPGLLEHSMQIAMRKEPHTRMLLQEVELHGYRLDVSLDCKLSISRR